MPAVYGSRLTNFEDAEKEIEHGYVHKLFMGDFVRGVVVAQDGTCYGPIKAMARRGSLDAGKVYVGAQRDLTGGLAGL